MYTKLVTKVRFWLIRKSCLTRSISSSHAHTAELGPGFTPPEKALKKSICEASNN
jgi:hypothetical protein